MDQRTVPGSPNQLAFHPQGQELALCGGAYKAADDPVRTREIYRYSAATGRPVQPGFQPAQTWVQNIQYSADGQKLYGTEGAGVSVWDVGTGLKRERLAPPPAVRAGFQRMAISSDERFLAATGIEAGATVAWELASGKVVFNEPAVNGVGWVLGFVSGSARLYRSYFGTLSFWDLDDLQPTKPQRIETRLGTCMKAIQRRDGRGLAVTGVGGNLRQFELPGGKETGSPLGGINSGELYDTPDGRLWYLGDQGGSVAWHPGAEKKIGPYLVTGFGAVYGVSPDGAAVATVDEARRVQLWRVPRPFVGSPEDAQKLVSTHTGFSPAGGSVLLLTDPKADTGSDPAKSGGAPAVTPPLVVTDYRELHNADLPRLKAWFAALPPNCRPLHLTAQEGSDGKRFDAIAIDDGTATRYEAHWAVTNTGGQDNTINRDAEIMFAKGWHRSVCVPYYSEGVYGRHHIYTKTPGYWELWTVESQLDAKLSEMRSQRCRPVSVIQYDGRLSLIGAPDEGRPWEFHRDLTAAQVRQKLDECRARKWRPDVIHRHRTEADKFVVVLVGNPHDEPWEYHAPLRVEEYEKTIAECRARGFRSQYVQSWVADGVVTYSALWLGDYKPAPVKLERAPPPRAVK